jgi:hypothetical protein
MRNPVWLLLFAAFLGSAAAARAATQDLVMPNVASTDPACGVQLPTSYQCTADRCAVPYSQPGRSGDIAVTLVCLPTSAPTGFERPAPEVRVVSIQAQNARGHLAIFEESAAIPAEQENTLMFCLWGKATILCGNAKVSKTNAASRAQVRAIKTFIRRLSLHARLTE